MTTDYRDKVGDTRVIDGCRQYLSPQGWTSCCSPPHCHTHRSITPDHLLDEHDVLARSLAKLGLSA